MQKPQIYSSILFWSREFIGGLSIFVVPFIVSWLHLALTGQPLDFGGAR